MNNYVNNNNNRNGSADLSLNLSMLNQQQHQQHHHNNPHQHPHHNQHQQQQHHHHSQNGYNGTNFLLYSRHSIIETHDYRDSRLFCPNSVSRIHTNPFNVIRLSRLEFLFLGGVSIIE